VHKEHSLIIADLFDLAQAILALGLGVGYIDPQFGIPDPNSAPLRAIAKIIAVISIPGG
jgi:hypothetical protein